MSMKIGLGPFATSRYDYLILIRFEILKVTSPSSQNADLKGRLCLIPQPLCQSLKNDI